MKKFISFILSLALAATTAISLCSCTPPPPQLMRAEQAYEDGYITDEDLMNIACIAGNGPLRKISESKYEPIEFTQTVEYSPISDEELQNIADELYGNSKHVLNQDIFIYYFGEYHGYYALGIYQRLFSHTGGWPYYYIYDIAWEYNKQYILYIYTTPEKTKV